MRYHLELIRCLLQLCVVQCTPEDLRPPEQVVSILDFPINVTVASNTEFQLIFNSTGSHDSSAVNVQEVFRVHLKSKSYSICSRILLFDVSKGEPVCSPALLGGLLYQHVWMMQSCCVSLSVRLLQWEQGYQLTVASHTCTHSQQISPSWVGFSRSLTRIWQVCVSVSSCNHVQVC